MQARVRVMPMLCALLITAGSTLAACAGAATPAPTKTPTRAVKPTMDLEERANAEIPSQYEGLTNPYTGNAAAIAEGMEIYDTHCAKCHGSGGAGDGPTSVTLDPAPADFTGVNVMQETTDGYLFWRVSEGGGMAPFNSGMPTWKAILTEERAWKVLAYIRTFSGN